MPCISLKYVFQEEEGPGSSVDHVTRLARLYTSPSLQHRAGLRENDRRDVRDYNMAAGRRPSQTKGKWPNAEKLFPESTEASAAPSALGPLQVLCPHWLEKSN